MLLACFLGGCLMGIVYELLCLPHTLLFSRLHPVALSLSRRLQRPAALQYRKKSTPPQPHRKHAWLYLCLRIVSDTLFCLISAVLLLLLLYATNQGQLRLSAPIALAIGFIFSHVTLARLFSLIVHLIYVITRAVLLWLIAIAVFPFYHLFLCTLRLLRPPCRKAVDRLGRMASALRARIAERLKKRASATRNISSTNEQSSPLPRPQHDGKRVFCSGGQRAGQHTHRS